MGALGGDVAGVEIDHHGLHLQDLGGLGLPGCGDGAGDHVDRRALPRGPCREGGHLLGRGLIRLDPDVVRAAIDALALVDETADRDQPVAIAEDDLHELRDLLGIGLVAEHVDLRGGVVEVAPRIEMDDVFLWPIGRRVVSHGLVLLWIGLVGGLVGHAGLRPFAAETLHRSVSGTPLTPTPLGMGAEPAFEEIARRRDARQQLARVGGLQDPHGAVGHALRQIGVEGHQLVVQLGRVLVDRREQRRRRRNPRHRGLHVGLVDRDLGGIDGLGDSHPVLDAGAPVLRVHGFAFPERRGAQTRALPGPRR